MWEAQELHIVVDPPQAQINAATPSSVQQPPAMDSVPQAAAIDAVPVAQSVRLREGIHVNTISAHPPPVLQPQPQPQPLPQATPAQQFSHNFASAGSPAGSSAGSSWAQPALMTTQQFALDTASDITMGSSAYTSWTQPPATTAHQFALNSSTDISVVSSTDQSWVHYHPAQIADDESASLYQSVADEGSLAPTVQAYLSVESPTPPASSLPQAPPPAKSNARPQQAQPLPNAKSKATPASDFYGVSGGRRAIHPNMSSAASCSHMVPTSLHSQESVFFSG